MKLRIVSALQELATQVAAHFTSLGHDISIEVRTVSRCALQYVEGTELAQLTELVSALKPILPIMTVIPLEGFDAEILLGDDHALGSWDFKIHADSEALCSSLRERLSTLGFDDDGREVVQVESNRLLYGGATPFARQVVRWILAQEGIQVTEKKEWGDSDNDLWLYVRDPRFESGDLKSCFPVELEGDDYATMLKLEKRLTRAGFTDVRVRLVDEETIGKFTLIPGPFTHEPGTLGSLRFIIEALLGEAEVDRSRCPLLEEEVSAIGARILLPLGAYAAGKLPPYVGAFPERWEVIVRSDDEAAVTPLMARFTEAGYTRLRFESLPDSAAGFRLHWGVASRHVEVTELVRAAIDETMETIGASPRFTLAVSNEDDNENLIRIDLSSQGIADGSLIERVLAGCNKWELSIKSPHPADFRTLTDTLRSMSFSEFDVQSEGDVGEAVIKYGGAPPILVEHIAGIVEEHTGVRPYLKKEWNDEDDDIWLYVPGDLDTGEEETSQIDLSGWLAEGTGMLEVGPLLDIADDRVRIGPITLPRRDGSHDLVPDASRFRHYCLDQRTAETLIHVAESVLLREPCLLEGETSVSKTSVIQYLAMLLNQPIVRLNLNGQTDTGELVGRFVPQSSAELTISVEELLAGEALLEEESRVILAAAQAEKRGLTRLETQQIVANERMAQHAWRWQDGLIISAMRQGWWVILDELNLAEPQILERLNSVLERDPMLVLSEYDNSVLGDQAHPIHPSFRIFATMNPAEYAGRSAMSPAYRDRWRGYRFVPPPDEQDYRAMLNFLVGGSDPDVRVFGLPYLGAEREPPLSVLQEVEGIDGFLRALARFHAALERSVGRGSRGGLGARRRESYVFTRRGLLSVMDYLANAIGGPGAGLRAMRMALYRYYLGRVSSPQDQAVVVRLLDAAGLGPDTWTLDPGDED